MCGIEGMRQRKDGGDDSIGFRSQRIALALSGDSETEKGYTMIDSGIKV